jgi:sigma-E factor negative regulatory protein RseB
VQAVGFTSIGEPATGMFIGALPGEAPQTPSRSTNRQPRVLHDVAAPFRAPRSAGDRFQLVGRYDEDDHTLHLFYSDGLFSVSVFEQKGELDPSGLPPGAESRTVAGRDVRQYRTPGGAVMVWQSGDVVYTTVSDAPLDQLDDVLADFTPPHDSALDRVTDFVLGPFSW